jgi:hypothetical protein
MEDYDTNENDHICDECWRKLKTRRCRPSDCSVCCVDKCQKQGPCWDEAHEDVETVDWLGIP